MTVARIASVALDLAAAVVPPPFVVSMRSALHG